MFSFDFEVISKIICNINICLSCKLVFIILSNFFYSKFRHLASGDKIFSLALIHRICLLTALNIVYETCQAIQKALTPVYLRPPAKQAWRNISKGFLKDWNFPNCVGAINGKHICITASPNSGSYFFNYKKYHSIILFAVCNHR